MQIRISILILSILITYNIGGCSIVGNNDNEEVVTMRINHFKQTAFGAFPQLVYLSQEGEEIGESQWTNFYDEIDNFEYEPGYVYNLKLRKETVQNPPQDASSFKYVLLKIISKEKVPAEEKFEIKLKWGGFNFVNNNGQEFDLMKEYDILCSPLCDDLAEQLINKDEVTGSFVHSENYSLKLVSLQ